MKLLLPILLSRLLFKALLNAQQASRAIPISFFNLITFAYIHLKDVYRASSQKLIIILPVAFQVGLSGWYIIVWTRRCTYTHTYVYICLVFKNNLIYFWHLFVFNQRNSVAAIFGDENLLLAGIRTIDLLLWWGEDTTPPGH
jgi:hypothetical protein